VWHWQAAALSSLAVAKWRNPEGTTGKAKRKHPRTPSNSSVQIHCPEEFFIVTRQQKAKAIPMKPAHHLARRWKSLRQRPRSFTTFTGADGRVLPQIAHILIAQLTARKPGHNRFTGDYG